MLLVKAEVKKKLLYLYLGFRGQKNSKVKLVINSSKNQVSASLGTETSNQIQRQHPSVTLFRGISTLLDAS